MSQEELQRELFWKLESYDNPVEVSYSREEMIEAIMGVINIHVAQVIGDNEVREETIDGETVYWYGPYGFKVRQYERPENKRDELRAEMRKRAGL